MSLRTTMTKNYLDKKGIPNGLVERYVMQARKKFDLFGIIDIIALYPEGVCGIQVCGSDWQEHIKKISGSEYKDLWLNTPGTLLELWGWRKLKLKRGGAAVRWTPRIKRFRLLDEILN